MRRVSTLLARLVADALLFGLDSLHVYRPPLRRRPFDARRCQPPPAARIAVLQRMELPYATQEQNQPLGGDLFRLMHSFAHRATATASPSTSSRTTSASSIRPPRAVIPAWRLQTLFETSLHRFPR